MHERSTCTEKKNREIQRKYNKKRHSRRQHNTDDGGQAMGKWWHMYRWDLGKVSLTFPAALFSVDARFARKIKRPQRGIKWPVTTK